MTAASRCPICAKPLSPTGRGRPPWYCSVGCRRRAEAYRAALPHMRVQLEWWRAQAARYPRDPIYRFAQNAQKVAAQIAQFERQTSTTTEGEPR